MKHFLLLIFFFFTLTSHVLSQGGVGIGTATPDSTAALDVYSENKGVLFPRLSQEQIDNIIIPANGLVVFNTTKNCLQIFISSNWNNLGCSDCELPKKPFIATQTITVAYEDVTFYIKWVEREDASGYKFSFENNYETATDISSEIVKTTVSGLPYASYSTLYTGCEEGEEGGINAYLWAYNACGNAETVYMTSDEVCSDVFSCDTATVVDADGNIYNTVKIGDQCWTKENLKTSKYLDGTDVLYHGNNSTAWTNDLTGAYTWYNNQSSNDATFGKLYNWYAVGNSGGLCPEGWKIPSDEEWKTMEKHLGMTEVDADALGWRGGPPNVGGKLKSDGALWDSPNAGANDSSGFTALPGGSVNSDYLSGFINTNGFWWTDTEETSNSAYYRDLANDRFERYRGAISKNFGFSVRCIYNCPVPETPTEDASTKTSGSITFKWDSPDHGSVTYKYNFTNDYASAISAGSVKEYTLSGIACEETHTIYIWATNACGHSEALSITKTSASCIFECGTTLVTDIDGNVYTTVPIGSQCWLKENLKTTRYANGDTIPNVTDDVEWTNLLTGGWSYYNNDSSYNNPYGKLYNYYAAADDRNVCPAGWKLPEGTDFEELTDFIGDFMNGGKLKATGTAYWNPPNTGATDEYGFSAYPAGIRNTDFIGINVDGELLINYKETKFVGIGKSTAFYSRRRALSPCPTPPLHCSAYDFDDYFLTYDDTYFTYTWTVRNNAGLSIRCIKE